MQRPARVGGILLLAISQSGNLFSMVHQMRPAIEKCPACQQVLARESRFCPSCGEPVEALTGEATGAFQPPEKLEPVTSRAPLARDQPRFTPGQLIAGRYRIVALLGQGGMGEVYRADDLKLGQSVALKFLPAQLTDEPERLARFHGEVRIARQVSHPNVCRVYDLAENHGQPLLTMEYIDGEDLASLLTRIGRLPEEKGIELARQLCLGLAAAHDKGVLHRDLKPANVMLDGRGQVRITDFGLASFAETVHDVRSGTPGYMAPEQLAGKEVSIQSDLFSLGLILYELFTGKRPYTAKTTDELRKLHADSTPTKPSSHVSGLNPEVERVIMRCLETEPRRRPRSAYEVVAGLPGGDPLAAALAAGQTPSPQLVADAPVEGSLQPLVGLALLAGILVGMVVIAILNHRTHLFRIVPLNESPEALAREARQVIQRLGYGEQPAVDSVYGFSQNDAVLKYLQQRDTSAARWDALPSGQPAAVYFWYRQSPQRLTQRLNPTTHFSLDVPGVVTPYEPPLNLPGMVTVFLDLKGRLIGFYAVPPELAATDPTSPIDWKPLFESAGLKWNAFQQHQAIPRHHPPVYADTRAAWTGVYPDRPDIPLWVEAAACDGEPVFFRIEPSESQYLVARASTSREVGLPLMILVAAFILIAFTAGVWLAWRNWHLGRANRTGALRLAIVLLFCSMLSWLLLAHHSFSFGEEYFGLLVPMFGRALNAAGLMWLTYLALEPYVRRRWPWRIVGWNRLLDGRLRDPLVGRDILIGGLACIVTIIVSQLGHSSSRWLNLAPEQPLAFAGTHFFNNPLGVIVMLPMIALPAMAELFLILVLVVILRREWLGVAIWSLIVIAIGLAGAISVGYEHIPIFFCVLVFTVAIGLFVLLRFGFLAFVASNVFSVLGSAPLTTDLSAWYFGATAAFVLVFGGLAIYAFVISLGGRSLVSQSWLGEE